MPAAGPYVASGRDDSPALHTDEDDCGYYDEGDGGAGSEEALFVQVLALQEQVQRLSTEKAQLAQQLADQQGLVRQMQEAMLLEEEDRAERAAAATAAEKADQAELPAAVAAGTTEGAAAGTTEGEAAAAGMAAAVVSEESVILLGDEGRIERSTRAAAAVGSSESAGSQPLPTGTEACGSELEGRTEGTTAAGVQPAYCWGILLAADVGAIVALWAGLLVYFAWDDMCARGHVSAMGQTWYP